MRGARRLRFGEQRRRHPAVNRRSRQQRDRPVLGRAATIGGYRSGRRGRKPGDFRRRQHRPGAAQHLQRGCGRRNRAVRRGRRHPRHGAGRRRTGDDRHSGAVGRRGAHRHRRVHSENPAQVARPPPPLDSRRPGRVPRCPPGSARTRSATATRKASISSVAAPGAPPGTDLAGHVTVLDGTAVVAEGDTDPVGHATLDLLTAPTRGPRPTPPATPAAPRSTPRPASSPCRPPRPTSTSRSTGPTACARARTPRSPSMWSAHRTARPATPPSAYDGNQIADGPVDGNGKISGTAAAVTAGDHQIQVSYAGDVRFEPNTATATLTVKEPVANPNAAGAAAAQASNPCPAAASACVDLANEQAWLQSGGQITYGPVPITSGAAGSRTRAGMFSVFWRDKNHKSSAVQQRADAELGVLRRRHRLPPGQPVRPVERLHPPVLGRVGDLLRHPVGRATRSTSGAPRRTEIDPCIPSNRPTRPGSSLFPPAAGG